MGREREWKTECVTESANGTERTGGSEWEREKGKLERKKQRKRNFEPPRLVLLRDFDKML